MKFIKKLYHDKPLRDFKKYCKSKFKDELVAIVIYGSYAFGYYDKKDSDYDLFVIFKNKVPRCKAELKRKFPKIDLPYFCTSKDLIKQVKTGHWAIYVTLLKSAKVLYKTKEYKKLLKEIKKVSFLEEILDVLAFNYTLKKDIEQIKKLKRFYALKWALYTTRKRLQFLTFLKFHKTIWDLNKNLSYNKHFLTKEERSFLKKLNKQVKKREKSFNKKEKAITLLKKVNPNLALELF